MRLQPRNRFGKAQIGFAGDQIKRGLAAQQRGDIASAVGHFRAVLLRDPRNAHALYFFALACWQLKQYDEAIRAMLAVVKLEPTHADAWYNLGKFYADKKMPETAALYYSACLEHNDQHVSALTNLGGIHLELGDTPLALQCYHRALAVNPSSDEAIWNRSFAKLAMGDFTGWQEYEHRWNTIGHKAEHWRDFMNTVPAWDGSPIPGDRLLLHAEQGLGDTIQFLRYLPLVRALSLADVKTEVQQPLFELARANFSGIVCRGDRMPDSDYHASLMSLPALCKTLSATDVPQTPYLNAA